jgi:hypothetical protein
MKTVEAKRLLRWNIRRQPIFIARCCAMKRTSAWQNGMMR